MFRVIPKGADRLDIELSGKVDSSEMRLALDEIVSASKGIDHGRMLYRISDFELPTLGALRVELFRLPELFRLIGRFDKVAVVADRKWLQTAGEIEGILIPGLTIRGFDPDQESIAESWLAE